MVNLENTYKISKIKIYNRTNCCQDRLDNTTVYITNDANGSDIVWQYDIKTAKQEEIINIDNKIGQFVKIRKNNPGYLSLAEIEVFGQEYIKQEKQIYHIIIKARWWIDSIQFKFTNNSLSQRFGGDGGDKKEIPIKNLKKIKVYNGQNGSKNIVGKIEFIYNNGNIRKIGLNNVERENINIKTYDIPNIIKKSHFIIEQDLNNQFIKKFTIEDTNNNTTTINNNIHNINFSFKSGTRSVLYSDMSHFGIGNNITILEKDNNNFKATFDNFDNSGNSLYVDFIYQNDYTKISGAKSYKLVFRGKDGVIKKTKTYYSRYKRIGWRSYTNFRKIELLNN